MSPEQDREAWMLDAACRGSDADLFFPTTKGRAGNGPKVTAAKKVCAGCRVREDCLEYAISERIRVGIWGGRTRDERAAIVAYRRRHG